ncbi:MAG: hypothetical protein L6R39_001994 [Caloplaca ligustica]|nr:MAG: hypothetical protein L6R39_001994 [Caloplaca ligustica]
MDFIEGIGERYLIGKANAVPQQLENLAKKQLKGDGAAAAEAGPASLNNTGKDEEIERLRRELADAKLSKAKQEVEKKKRSVVGSGVMIGERPGKSQPAAGNVSGKSARSGHAPHAPSKPAERKYNHVVSSEATQKQAQRRGRSDSIKTAVAARPHLAEPVKFREVRYSKDETPHQRGPVDEHRKNTEMISSQASTKNRAHRGEETHKIIQSTVLKQYRSAPDLCVVEVTEEEPLTRRLKNRNEANVVEVIERDRNRTRYVIR